MAYVRNLYEVTEIKETTDRKEVNDLIRNGWMLIGVITPNRLKPEVVLFSLGKVPVDIDVP